MPPLPPWAGIHPLLVHLPIGLWLGVPLLLLIGLAERPWAAGMRWAALLLMLMGSIGALLAVESGEAGAQIADRTPEMEPVLEQHEEMAEMTETLMLTSTALWALVLVLTTCVHRLPRPRLVLRAGLLLVILLQIPLLYFLVNTGHRGGLLVHQYGIKAMISVGP